MIYIYNGLDEGDRNEIHQLSPEGRILRIIRRMTDPIPVTREESEGWLEWRYGNGSRAGSSQTSSPFHPFVGALRVEKEGRGHVWVKDRPGRWSVFTPEGRWIGVVEMPTWFFPAWIENDFLFGGAYRFGGYPRETVFQGHRLDRRVQ